MQIQINFDDLFSVTPDGTTHDYVVLNADAVEFSGLERTLNFSLIDVIGGGVVSVASNPTLQRIVLSFVLQANTTQAKVILTDCNPGYKYDNHTSICEYVRGSNVILRPDIQGRYVYLKVILCGL